MKLCSGRKYKNDLSDIIGILHEHEKRNTPITMCKINNAVMNLYGGWEHISADSQKFIEDVMAKDNLDIVYNNIKSEEKHSKDVLTESEQDYPGVMSVDNVDNILNDLKRRIKANGY